jgi:hypothetical protein
MDYPGMPVMEYKKHNNAYNVIPPPVRHAKVSDISDKPDA